MLVISGLVTLGLFAIAVWLPVPYVRLSPGPTFNVIGDKDGTPVISVSGTTTYPASGTLDMTTVYERGGPRTGLTLFEAISGWMNATDAVMPRELLFPDDVSGDDVKQEQALLFSNSQSSAVSAALRHLGLPVRTKVIASLVYDGSPAAAEGGLQPGDVIVSVDGVAVDTPQQVGDAVRAKPVGSALDFVIERDGKQLPVTIATVDSPREPGTAYLGIGVGVDYRADFDISFALDDVGGPSAGLIFATGLVDKLTPGDLTGGKHVAGTGTIEPDGTVGPIGGIRQKLAGAREAGAELFLMPADHCAEAEGHIPDGLTVVPVHTLDEAVSQLQAWTSGGTVASCPVAVTAAPAP